MIKIGRNDPCPCGSGKKFKKCCIESWKNDVIDGNSNISAKDMSSNQFPFLLKKVGKLNEIFKEYRLKDLVKAVFCINICVNNRSALENALALNQCLMKNDFYGEERINNYDTFKKVFKDIQLVLEMTPYDDYTMEDFGEVKYYWKNKSYNVILGNGYEQVYGVYQFLSEAVKVNNTEAEFEELLEYTSDQIDFFKETNITDNQTEVRFVLPSNELYDQVNYYFEVAFNELKVKNIAKLFVEKNSDVSRQHFVFKDDGIYPLVNNSILLDFYSIQVRNKSVEVERDIVEFSIMSNLSKLTKLQDPKNPSVFFPVSLVDHERFISKFMYTFLLVTQDAIILGLNDSRFSKSELNREIQLIKDLHKSDKLMLAEIVSGKGSEGQLGVKVGKNQKLKIVVFDNTTDITFTSLVPRDINNKYLRCLAIDIIYLLFFMKDISELVRFIDYQQNKLNNRIFSYGGLSTSYFMWKESDEIVQKGAVEFNLMTVMPGYTDEFVWNYFKNNLVKFPYREDEHLFDNFHSWKIRPIEDGFVEYVHKINGSFGGNGKKYMNNCFVYFVHNVSFYDSKEYSDELMGLITLVDDLNLRNSKLYNSWFEKNDYFKEKTIQLIHMPMEYAKRIDSTGFTLESEREYVFSDMSILGNVIIIRYSVDSEKLYSDLGTVEDRSVEARYYLELLKPLEKVIGLEYNELEKQIDKTIHLPKGVSTFAVSLKYKWSDGSLGYHVSDKAYHLVRKEIAKLCNEIGILEGEYKGKEANNVIRKIQSELITYFETRLLDYNRDELHKELLSTYSKIVHNIDIHMKRYGSFQNVEVTELNKIQDKTIRLREEEKHNLRVISFILETNINLENDRGNKSISREELEFVVAFSNWLVVLFNAADICFKSEVEKIISVDFDFTIDIIDSEEMKNILEGVNKRIYENTDYTIKMDDIDKEFLDAVLLSFMKDTGINFKLLLSFIEYLQLIYDNDFATEIFPNVYSAKRKDIIDSFRKGYEEEVPLDEANKIFDYLTVNPENLKMWKNKIVTFLPISEREQRDNRFDLKPLCKMNQKIVFSPVTMYDLHNKWKSGITNFYLPYEKNLDSVMGDIKKWKKRYEDLIVDDLVEVLENNDIKFVWPEAWLHKLDKMGNHPRDIGDYDVLAFDETNNTLWIFECKVLSKVGSIHEAYMQQYQFFLKHKYDEKFQRRIDYIEANFKSILEAQNIKVSDNVQIQSYMITNKILVSRYKKVDFKILTLHEFETLLRKK